MPPTENQQQRQNQRSEGGSVQNQPLPQRMPRNRRGTSSERGGRQTSPTPYTHISEIPNQNITDNYNTRDNESTQVSFLGRGRGRGRSRGQGRGGGRGRGRKPQQQ